MYNSQGDQDEGHNLKSGVTKWEIKLGRLNVSQESFKRHIQTSTRRKTYHSRYPIH
jgi:hypothetical protein